MASKTHKSQEIIYPEGLNAQERKAFKQKILKENPESFIADYKQTEDWKTKTNLIFFTENLKCLARYPVQQLQNRRN